MEMQEIIEAYERNKQQVMPAHTLDALNRYLEHGIEPGSFLTAVLCNDLQGAFMKADDMNTANMFAIVKYLYNNIPGHAWGSVEHVRAWMARFNRGGE